MSLIGANIRMEIKHVNRPIAVSTHFLAIFFVFTFYQFLNNNSVNVLHQISTYTSMLSSVADYLSLWSVNYRKTKFVWHGLLFTKPSWFST